MKPAITEKVNAMYVMQLLINLCQELDAALFVDQELEVIQEAYMRCNSGHNLTTIEAIKQLRYLVSALSLHPEFQEAAVDLLTSLEEWDLKLISAELATGVHRPDVAREGV